MPESYTPTTDLEAELFQATRQLVHGFENIGLKPMPPKRAIDDYTHYITSNCKTSIGITGLYKTPLLLGAICRTVDHPIKRLPRQLQEGTRVALSKLYRTDKSKINCLAVDTENVPANCDPCHLQPTKIEVIPTSARPDLSEESMSYDLFLRNALSQLGVPISNHRNNRLDASILNTTNATLRSSMALAFTASASDFSSGTYRFLRNPEEDSLLVVRRTSNSTRETNILITRQPTTDLGLIRLTASHPDND